METRIKTVVALLSLVLIASLAGVSLYQGYAGRIEDDSTRILNVRDEFARLDPNGSPACCERSRRTGSSPPCTNEARSPSSPPPGRSTRFPTTGPSSRRSSSASATSW